MKYLNRTLATVLLSCVGYFANAQFHHEFSSTTTIQDWGNNIPNDHPGCFVRYSSSHPAYYVYSASVDGVKGNGKAIYFPFVNHQGAFELKIEYTAPAAVSLWTNFYNGSSWTNGANTTAPASPGVRSTHTIRTSNLTGGHRFGLFPYNEITIHSVTITNVTYAPGPGCSVTNSTACTDSDNDGECDATDDFPNDPNKAFSSTTPWMNWMYEDLFPAYGDFDFNDMVVSAEREVITDADNDVRFVKVKAVVKAAGAGRAQGWAVELSGINPSDVVGVNGSDVTSGVMSLNGNGTENAQANAVVPVFDNFNNIINRAGGAFFNTVAGSPTGSCDTVEVMIELKKSSAIQISDLNYNFFSFRTNDRAHEIHEMGFAPTSLADMSLFGTKMDATDLNNGDTYVSVDGLPWAISSSGDAYPTEKTDIVEAFMKMAAWAQSGGTQYLDWHTNTSEGTYRNSSKIY